MSRINVRRRNRRHNTRRSPSIRENRREWTAPAREERNKDERMLAARDVEAALADGGLSLLRYSGTRPLRGVLRYW